MGKEVVRVVTRGADGKLRIRDFPTSEALLKMHTQIGIDDCSTDLALRGMPVFRGLVGPMPEGKNVVRYESPEVFETVTKEWSTPPARRRRRSRAKPE
ncbi:MAG: hypothetical protein AB7O62_04480 [Pirellulales bacterium]